MVYMYQNKPCDYQCRPMLQMYIKIKWVGLGCLLQKKKKKKNFMNKIRPMTMKKIKSLKNLPRMMQVDIDTYIFVSPAIAGKTLQRSLCPLLPCWVELTVELL